MRDLSKLNRDLSKVLFVTADENALSMQPENAVKVSVQHAAVHWHAHFLPIAGLNCFSCEPAAAVIAVCLCHCAAPWRFTAG